MFVCVCVCVCVLTGLQTKQYDQIMRWWGFKPQSGIAKVLDTAAYCYVLISFRPYNGISHRSYHTISFSHLGFPCLRPSISAYHTRSLSHLDFYRLYPRIMTSKPNLPPPSGYYCMPFSPNLLLLLFSREINTRVSRSCFSVASWHHQAPLLLPPPSHPFYLAHTSNSGHNATHCTMVYFRIPI